MRHIPIPGEYVMNHNGINILTGNGDVTHREGKWPHQEWDVPLWECTSSQGMWMYVTGNAHPRGEWRCVSPGMHIFTGNPYPHQECT